METVFQDIVREVRDRGRTVLLSSHILSEVEALCDRVTIIRNGRAAESGTFAELRHLTRTTVVVETARPPAGLASLAGVHDPTIEGSKARFSVESGDLNAVLERLVQYDVRSLTSTPPTLEELFLRHYGDQTRQVDGARGGVSTMRNLTAADFAGTRRLTRLAVRRDRYTLPAWWAGLGLFVAATTAMFAQSLAQHEDLVRETQMVATNTGMRLLGLTSGPSVGGYLLHREYVTLAVLAALMSTFAVIRHTRQNEELGRAEMLGSTVVGRYAGLAAGVLVAVAADIVLALVLAAAIAVNGLPVEGALLAGASVAAVGLVWVGVAAVTCQISSTTRGAAGIAAGALGVAFALSGIGNMLGTVDEAGLRVTSAWPAWLSPIGWGQQTRPFGGGALVAVDDRPRRPRAPARCRGRTRLQS